MAIPNSTDLFYKMIDSLGIDVEDVSSIDVNIRTNSQKFILDYKNDTDEGVVLCSIITETYSERKESKQ